MVKCLRVPRLEGVAAGLVSADSDVVDEELYEPVQVAAVDGQRVPRGQLLKFDDNFPLRHCAHVRNTLYRETLAVGGQLRVCRDDVFVEVE